MAGDLTVNNLTCAALTGTPTAPTASTGTNTTQLATTAYANAIAGGTTVPAVSKATNGYMKMANGLIIQWGYSSISAVTFPITFPTACLNVNASSVAPITSNTWAEAGLANTSWSTSGCNLAIKDCSGATWIAIGY
jgi:hypothetical protein